jgi:hypothetical protein
LRSFLVLGLLRAMSSGREPSGPGWSNGTPASSNTATVSVCRFSPPQQARCRGVKLQIAAVSPSERMRSRIRRHQREDTTASTWHIYWIDSIEFHVQEHQNYKPHTRPNVDCLDPARELSGALQYLPCPGIQLHASAYIHPFHQYLYLPLVSKGIQLPRTVQREPRA